ncbi:MAG: ester cyclase [Methanospirillum sp.]
MSTEKNKEVVRRVFEEVMNQGNLRAVDELVADDYTLTDPPGLPPGREGLRALANMYRTGAPDLHMTVEDVVAEGDQAVARWVATGTLTGEMMGMPPTGKKVSFRAISWFRLKNGRIAEEWTQFKAS